MSDQWIAGLIGLANGVIMLLLGIGVRALYAIQVSLDTLMNQNIEMRTWKEGFEKRTREHFDDDRREFDSVWDTIDKMRGPGTRKS